MLNKLIELNEYIGFKRYAKNIGWMFFGNIFRMLVTLFVGIWLVRYLGPAKLGDLSYAQSIALILIAISGLGFESIVIKSLVGQDFLPDEILATSLFLRLIASLIICVILSIFLYFNQLDSETNLLIFTISLGSFFLSFNIVDCYFQAKVISKYSVLSNLIAFSLISLLKVLLILNNAPVLAFAVLNLLEFILIAFFVIYFYQKVNVTKIIKWRFNLGIAKYLIKKSWPLTISIGIAVVLDKIDQIMIRAMMNSDAVGHYVAASRLSEVWYFVGTATVATLFPAILNAHNQDIKRYHQRMQRLFDLLVILSILIAIPVSIFSVKIVDLIYGNAYADSAVVLAIHIWTGLFIFFKAASGNWLVINHLQIFSLYRNLLAIVINVVLNFLLIPIYGIAGSAISMLITLFIATYLLNAMRSQTRECFLMQTKALCMHFLLRK